MCDRGDQDEFARAIEARPITAFEYAVNRSLFTSCAVVSKIRHAACVRRTRQDNRATEKSVRPKPSREKERHDENTITRRHGTRRFHDRCSNRLRRTRSPSCILLRTWWRSDRASRALVWRLSWLRGSLISDLSSADRLCRSISRVQASASPPAHAPTLPLGTPIPRPFAVRHGVQQPASWSAYRKLWNSHRLLSKPNQVAPAMQPSQGMVL